MDVMHQEDSASEPGNERVIIDSIAIASCLGDGVFQSFKNSCFIALGLQFSNEPGSCVCQRFIIDIDRVLGHQNTAKTECSCLFEHGHQRTFRRWFGYGREKAEYLVEIQQRPEACCPRLRAHPCQHVFQKQGHEKHSLALVEMGQIKNALTGFSFGAIHQRVDVERFPLQPSLEAWRGKQIVKGQSHIETLFFRKECIGVEDADLSKRRGLNRENQPLKVDILTLSPEMIENRSKKDSLPAADSVSLDSGQAEQCADGSGDPFAYSFSMFFKGEFR